MNKYEKKFIKFICKSILCIIESVEWRYCSFDPEEWTSFGIETLKEARYDEIQEIIDKAEARGVNENVLAQLQSFNNCLFYRGIFY